MKRSQSALLSQNTQEGPLKKVKVPNSLFLLLGSIKLLVTQDRKNPLILGNENGSVRDTIPGIDVPPTFEAWLSDSQESIILKHCSAQTSRLFQYKARKFLLLTKDSEETEMFPGDILDLVYSPETYTARFSFMLESEPAAAQSESTIAAEKTEKMDLDNKEEDETANIAKAQSAPVETFSDYLTNSLMGLVDSSDSKGDSVTTRNPVILRAQTMRNDAHIVDTLQPAAPIMLASGPNLLARYSTYSVRLSFSGPTRFTVTCSLCKPKDGETHLFNCTHGWSTMLAAFQIPSKVQVISLAETAFLGDFEVEAATEFEEPVDVSKLVAMRTDQNFLKYKKAIFVFPTCVYILYSSGDCRIRMSETHEWIIECSCEAYRMARICSHALDVMRELRTGTYFQDARYVCEQMFKADHSTLVNFGLSFGYKSSMDELLDCAMTEYYEDMNIAPIPSTTRCEFALSSGLSDLYSFDPDDEIDDMDSCTVAYIAPNLITECEGHVVVVELNARCDSVVNAKCGCLYTGLFWCTHVASVVANAEGLGAFDYIDLKRGFAGIPHHHLVTLLICLFSQYNLTTELGLAQHFEKELVPEWLAKSSKLPTLKFISHVDGVLAKMQADYERLVNSRHEKKVTLWKDEQRKKHMYGDSDSDSDSDDWGYGGYGYYGRHYRQYSPASEDMDEDEVDSGDDAELSDLRDDITNIETYADLYFTKVNALADSSDYSNAFRLLQSITANLKFKTNRVDCPTGLVGADDLEAQWVELFQKAPLNEDECLMWSEKLTPYITPSSTLFRNAQAVVLTRYSMLLENDEKLDEKITEGLEDAAGKFDESKLLGFAKGAHSRGMIAAAYLLCLKVLTVPTAKDQTTVAAKTRSEVVALLCKMLTESSKGSADESMNGTESLFRISSRSAAKFLYNHYKTEDSFQMDLSTLFATLNSVTSNILASILLEFTVLAARDFLKFGPEIFSLAEGLLNARKPRHAFEVGLIAHSKPEPIGLQEVSSLCDMALSSNISSFRERIYKSCLLSNSDTKVLQIAAKFLDNGAPKMAYALAIKAGKLDIEDSVNGVTVVPFICNTLKGLNEGKVFNGLSELLYMVEVSPRYLIELKTRLDALSFHKSSLLVGSKLAELDTSTIDRFVKQCLNYSNHDHGSAMLRRFLGSQNNFQRLFELAKSLNEQKKHLLAWDAIVRAGASLQTTMNPYRYNAGYYGVYAHHGRPEDAQSIEVAKVAIDISSKIPNFDPNNIVEYITDFLDQKSILDLIASIVPGMIHVWTPEMVRCVYNICKVEYQRAVNRAATYSHCGHSQCRKCDNHYRAFTDILKIMYSYGFTLGSNDEARGAVQYFKQQHSRKVNMIAHIDAMLVGGVSQQIQQLRKKFLDAGLTYKLDPRTMPAQKFDALAMTKRLPVQEKTHDERKALMRRLEMLQRELHIHKEADSAGVASHLKSIYMHTRSTLTIRKEIQSVITMLELLHSNGTNDATVPLNANYSKFITPSSQPAPASTPNTTSTTSTTTTTTTAVKQSQPTTTRVVVDITDSEPYTYTTTTTKPPVKATPKVSPPQRPNTTTTTTTTTTSSKPQIPTSLLYAAQANTNTQAQPQPQVQNVQCFSQQHQTVPQPGQNAAQPQPTIVVSVTMVGKPQMKFRVARESAIRIVVNSVVTITKKAQVTLYYNGLVLSPNNTFGHYNIGDDAKLIAI